MRPKIVVAVLACAAAVLAALLWARFHVASTPAADPSAALAAAAASPVPAPTSAPGPDHPATRARPAEEPAVAPGTPAYDDWVRATQAKLIELSSRGDDESLRTILGGLASPEPGVRKTALAATRQFGSRDAIPYLQEAVEHTDDPREKVAILDTIGYLKMPSLTELRESARIAGGAPR